MSILNIKRDCEFDAVSLGEVMLRLDPGDTRIRAARTFTAWEGGGEYNVARGLSRCFGLKTAIVTQFAKNEIGRLLEGLIMQGGADTRFIHWLDYDGIGRACRNGLNFTERGFGVRSALGVSDRANTAVSKLAPGDIDWEHIFGGLGVKVFHTGGIFAALSDTCAQLAVEAAKCAGKHGTAVSYDLNYRPSLWQSQGGLAKAQEINRQMARLADVIIGNEEDFSACLGFEIAGNSEDLSELNIDGYKQMLKDVKTAYPNLKVIASTLRAVKTATRNDWSAICLADGEVYQGITFDDLEVYDRVGGGDSFASGLLYGLLRGCDAKTALDYGICHGALAMTTPGDTSFASLSEVEGLIKGKAPRVVR